MVGRFVKLSLLFSDATLFLSGLVAVVVSILDFSGALSEIPWLANRIGVFTLLATGLVLISISIERRGSLEIISERLRSLEQSAAFGSYYISDTNEAVRQLEKISAEATDSMMAIGSKSSAKKYLKNIERKVFEGGFVYYRLLAGSYITHYLHEHLERLIDNENVHIAWTEREKFGTIAITEHATLVAFPTPREEKFSGLMLPGKENARLYTQYFLEAYTGCQSVTKKDVLRHLCRECGVGVSGDVRKLREIVSRCEPSVVNIKVSLKPDLLS